jgi:hypothetical protein
MILPIAPISATCINDASQQSAVNCACSQSAATPYFIILLFLPCPTIAHKGCFLQRGTNFSLCLAMSSTFSKQQLNNFSG